LTKEAQHVTQVDNQGVPVSPIKVANGYNITTGIIVREGVKIICTNFRVEEQEVLWDALLSKLFDRY
jgi:hypothetical protein